MSGAFVECDAVGGGAGFTMTGDQGKAPWMAACHSFGPFIDREPDRRDAGPTASASDRARMGVNDAGSRSWRMLSLMTLCSMIFALLCSPGAAQASSPGASGPGTAAQTPESHIDLSILPSGRATEWLPGMNAVGGIPSRTTVFRTIEASTFGNGSLDATAGIQAAIDACPQGQVVRLSAGDFLINTDDPLFINKGIVLRGAGPAATRLIKTSAGENPLVIIGQRWPEVSASVNLTANASKGATSVQVTSSAGFSVGQIVLVDEITDDSFVTWGSDPAVAPGGEGRGWFTRYDRPVGQMLEISAINGNRVSFTTALHIAFDTAHTAQLTRYTHPGVRNAGLEDLYVRGGRNGNISMSLAMYSWVRNVDSDASYGDSIGLISCFRCVVRDSYFHDTTHPYPGGAGYLLSVGEYTADSLIENSIFINANKVMVMRASGGGNVVGYNYFDNGYIGDYHDWVETGINASHMTCPHFELFEGNQAFNADGDNTWGGAVYVTFFRNHLTGQRRSFGDISNRRAAGLMYGHYYYSFIGNVLGYAGMSPAPYGGFAYEDVWPWEDDPVPMWRIGYNPEDWNAPAEGRVVNTLFRHGNFDFATSSIRWDAGTSNHTLPPSLYLTSKPAFFGSGQWPWVDPLSGTTHTLPARARFDGVPPGPCTIAVDPAGTPSPLPSSGGGGDFSVTVGEQSCNWAVSTDAAWITITNPSGAVTGNGSVAYAVAANSGASRTANINVAVGSANAQFSVTQDGTVSGGPVITEIRSKTGKAGSKATIYGSGFSATANQNTVVFGARKAKVAKATAGVLKVRIPKRVKGTVGVSVTVNGLKSNVVAFTVK